MDYSDLWESLKDSMEITFSLLLAIAALMVGAKLGYLPEALDFPAEFYVFGVAIVFVLTFGQAVADAM